MQAIGMVKERGYFMCDTEPGNRLAEYAVWKSGDASEPVWHAELS